ncbi:hypothetical protein [Caulobacter sp.]|uniref:hypothetical protein n=1 Tax=Caulobacter sp. TaxID=78 RepID=UPI003BAE5E0C
MSALLPLTAPDPAVGRDQGEIVRALQSGAASGAKGPLTRIDTHMSHVFLDGDHAYKLKRAVRYPFVDFSTLALRHAACDSELLVNRAFAPELYQAVVPVVRMPGGAIALAEPPSDADPSPSGGEIIDWVVKMRRFPDGALLDDLARDGRLTADQVRAAVTQAAAAHQTRPPLRDQGRASDYAAILAGLRRTQSQGAARCGQSIASDDFFLALETALHAQEPLIEARRMAGWVRQGHGDLHLRNLCLFDGKVTAFDALEFDPALAIGDVLYDVGFLLMDLKARGLDILANQAMNAYWDASGQPEAALALLPLFMAMRAAVRMAVAMEAGDVAQAEHYRRTGRMLLETSPPRVVAIGGLPGSGKRALADIVAPNLPGPCGARKLPALSLAHEPLDEADRAGRCASPGRATLAAVQAGASVVVSAPFVEAPARACVEASAPSRFTGIWLDAPLETRLAPMTRDPAEQAASMHVALAAELKALIAASI